LGIRRGGAASEYFVERSLAGLQPDRGFPHAQAFGDHAASAGELLDIYNRLATVLAASRCGAMPGTGPFGITNPRVK
jgi:hypothetical protein